MFQNCCDDGTSTILLAYIHLWTWRIFHENPSKRFQKMVTNSTVFRGSAIFSAKIQKFSKLRPNILNILSNFIFWFDASKCHIQTKNTFPKNDNLNHNLSVRIYTEKLCTNFSKDSCRKISTLSRKDLCSILVSFRYSQIQ